MAHSSPGYLCSSCALLPASAHAAHTQLPSNTRAHRGVCIYLFWESLPRGFQSQGWEEREGAIREKKLEDCCLSNGETAHAACGFRDLWAAIESMKLLSYKLVHPAATLLSYSRSACVMPSNVLPLLQDRELPQHVKSFLSPSLTSTLQKACGSSAVLWPGWEQGRDLWKWGKNSQKDTGSSPQHVVYLM